MVRPPQTGQRFTIKYGLILANLQQKAIFKQLVSQITSEEDKLDINAADIKVYDGITGEDVTAKFDIKVEMVFYGTSKASMTKAISSTDATPVIDTTKFAFAFGRYYKFDIPAVVKDIDATTVLILKIQPTKQFTNTTHSIRKLQLLKNQLKHVKTTFQFHSSSTTKRLEGRELTAGEFSFVLKDKDNKVLQTVTNDKDGHIKFENSCSTKQILVRHSLTQLKK